MLCEEAENKGDIALTAFSFMMVNWLNYCLLPCHYYIGFSNDFRINYTGFGRKIRFAFIKCVNCSSGSVDTLEGFQVICSFDESFGYIAENIG